MSINEQQLLQYKLKSSLLFFTRYFYKKRFNRKFIVNEHHLTICNALERVLRGECTRLIINIAPRYGKTELAVKNFIAHGLALNPASKWIHLTYAANLALDNSEEARDIVKSPEYAEIFGDVEIKKDSNSKQKWYTNYGGGVYATASGGQVTGFGAGNVDEEDTDLDEFLNDLSKKNEFGGAIIIDDPIKPEDAHSTSRRNKINERFETTIRNRVNSRNTPIIVIGQRLHENDLSGYLMAIEPDEWEVIKIPCLKPDNTALWPHKHTADELFKLKRINPYVFESQYQQEPKPIQSGNEFYKLFSYANNVSPCQYNPDLPIHISFDFNVNPGMHALVFQIDGKNIYCIDEIQTKNPNNTTKGICKEFKRRPNYHSHKSGLFIYGDPSGKQQDTRGEKGHNDFKIIEMELAEYKPSLRLLSKAPAIVIRGQFINSVFAEGFDGLNFVIDPKCTGFIEDLTYLKEAADGTKLKEKVKGESGVTFEKYGHYSDCADYMICKAFESSLNKYQRGESNVDYVIGDIRKGSGW